MATMKNCRFVCAIFAMLFASQSSAHDQQDGRPSAPNQIQVHVDEVLVPVTVSNKKGALVLDLSRSDFHVLDNGSEQSISQWDLGGEPLATALVVETSSRIQAMAPVIHKMSSIFTETVMALNGEAAVVTYDSSVEVRQTFTTDHDEIQKAITKLDFQTPNTKLYDGMAKAVEILKSQPLAFRRVMLVVGESQDYISEARLGDVVREAQRANISIYAVGPSSTTADLRYGNTGLGNDRTLRLRTPKKLPSASVKDPPPTDPFGDPYVDFLTPAVWLLTRATNEVKNHQLEVAVAATGGVHYRALKDETILTALDRIGGELHAQYMLSYSPSAPRPGFNEIKVMVSRPNLTIRARPGYFVAPPAH
jgi:VWFA-related protein